MLPVSSPPSGGLYGGGPGKSDKRSEPESPGPAVRLWGQIVLGAILKLEGDSQVDLVACDLAITYKDVHVLDPATLHTSKLGSSPRQQRGLVGSAFTLALFIYTSQFSKKIIIIATAANPRATIMVCRSINASPVCRSVYNCKHSPSPCADKDKESSVCV